MSLSLMSVPASGNNPYLHLLYAELPKHGIALLPDEAYWSRCLREERPDFVHFHWPENTYGHHRALAMPPRAAWFFARIAAMRQLGTRVIFTFHNVAQHENAWPAFHRAARAQMLALSDVVLVNFRAARDYLAREYGRTESVYVVPHGSYRGHYPDRITREEARRTLNIPEHARVLLLFGELRAYKNISRVVRAFRAVDAPSARLLVVGRARHPEYLAEVQQAAAGDARVLLQPRHVGEDEVQRYLRASDVAVLGQDTFSSGSAVLALDFDLPLLGVRQNHVAEIAQGESLIELRSVGEDDLRDGIVRALSKDLAQGRMDARHASEQLAWPPIRARFAEILRSHADSSQARD